MTNYSIRKELDLGLAEVKISSNENLKRVTGKVI